METIALSQVLRIIYPAVITLAAATLAWANSVWQPPNLESSFQRTIATVDTSCFETNQLNINVQN